MAFNGFTCCLTKWHQSKTIWYAGRRERHRRSSGTFHWSEVWGCSQNQCTWYLSKVFAIRIADRSTRFAAISFGIVSDPQGHSIDLVQVLLACIQLLKLPHGGPNQTMQRHPSADKRVHNAASHANMHDMDEGSERSTLSR